MVSYLERKWWKARCLDIWLLCNVLFLTSFNFWCLQGRIRSSGHGLKDGRCWMCRWMRFSNTKSLLRSRAVRLQDLQPYRTIERSTTFQIRSFVFRVFGKYSDKILEYFQAKKNLGKLLSLGKPSIPSFRSIFSQVPPPILFRNVFSH